MEQKHYTYIHRKIGTGDVFYVGKGSNNRIMESGNRRNIVWRRVVEKYGYYTEYDSFFENENDAFEREMKLITHYKSMGLCIANLTGGGDGGRYGRKVSSRPVSGINQFGHIIEFISVNSAIRYLRSIGFQNASDGNVRGCISRKKKTAYGMVWWCTGDAPRDWVKKYHGTGAKRERIIFCSNGMQFSNSTAAVEWLKSIGHVRASQSAIQRCYSGNGHVAYGFCWSVVDTPDHPVKKKTKLEIKKEECKKRKELNDNVVIRNSLGLEFIGYESAICWAVNNISAKFKRSRIKECITGKRKSAGGIEWWLG